MKTFVTALAISLAIISCDSKSPTENDVTEPPVNQPVPDTSLNRTGDTLQMNRATDTINGRTR